MTNEALFDLVMRHFLDISAIPRGSGNEEAVSAYIEKFAGDRGLFCVRDQWNNVFIRRPAAAGYENVPVMVFQGHVDMVCEANSGTVHDFTKDPIRVIRDGDILRADGTTLGADNGVAVAVMMALLETEDLASPAIECIFTTSEETGLDGMRNFDASVVTGRRMINMDSAGEGEATAACAGGVRSDFVMHGEKEAVPDGFAVLEVSIRGLFGGHSGEDIHLGRLSANLAMGRVLQAVSAVCDMRLVSVAGGTKDNAIPREASAVIAVSDRAAAVEAVREMEEVLRARLICDDRNFMMTVEEAAGCSAFGKDFTARLVSLLRVLPLGVRQMSRDIPGLVETSANLGVMQTLSDGVKLTTSSRSLVESELDSMIAVLDACGVLAGVDVIHRNRYPGWAFCTDSVLQEAYLNTWKKLYGTEGKIIGIHAGLECGLFMKKVPDMDIISIGPDVKNLHSPDETVTVSSFERMVRLVVTMLAEMK